jgi:glycosyltransferase involved in cell wall biosynthesis
VPQDAKIVLWGGGIWNWLDPITLVKAWPKVLAQHPDATLIFLGTRYPNPIVPEHRIARETIALAEASGEKDKSIFFIEWLSYPEHQALLREADIGVTFQPEHVEARFSIRTRIIDYFSAELPCLVSEGDVTAEWVQAYGVGQVVPTCDSVALAQALVEMLAVPKQAYRAAFQRLHAQFHWHAIVEPLRRYCQDGDYAADRQRERYTIPKYHGGWVPRSNPTVENALTVLREKGLIAFTGQTLRFIGKAVKRKLGT